MRANWLISPDHRYTIITDFLDIVDSNPKSYQKIPLKKYISALSGVNLKENDSVRNKKELYTDIMDLYDSGPTINATYAKYLPKHIVYYDTWRDDYGVWVTNNFLETKRKKKVSK